MTSAISSDWFRRILSSCSARTLFCSRSSSCSFFAAPRRPSTFWVLAPTAIMSLPSLNSRRADLARIIFSDSIFQLIFYVFSYILCPAIFFLFIDFPIGFGDGVGYSGGFLRIRGKTAAMAIELVPSVALVKTFDLSLLITPSHLWSL